MSMILHILCRNLDFSKRSTAPLKGGLDICMVQLFKDYFMFCLDIVPAKTHCIAPKEDYLFRMVCLFLILHFWQVWGCCNYVEVI